MRGICEDMCPEQEVKLRTKEKLLHFFEYSNVQNKTPGILVKQFSRSAAGVKVPKSKELRTERCLQRTVEYLLKDIIMDNRKAYHVKYDFIFDRLRAVRQEIVMQSYDERQTIRLLEPMIMFLSYSRYRLCEDTVNFDAKICEQHLLECLKRTLTCYDVIYSQPEANLNVNQKRSRVFIEALYQLFNLGAVEALKRASLLPADIRNDDLFKPVFSIAMHLYCCNYWRVFQGIKKLPHILCAIAALKLQALRRKFLQIFAHAYSSKQLHVPIDFICKLMLYDNPNQCIAECKYYNIQVNGDQRTVQFLRSDFKTDLIVPNARYESWIQDKLKTIYLPEVILLKKL